MNARLVALTLAVSAAACGADDTQRPARTPASTSTTTSAVEDPAYTTPAVPRSPQPDLAPPPSTFRSDATSPSSPASDVDRDRDGAVTGTNPDNTKINQRDRDGAVTPADQGNSASETEITAAIRRGLMANKGLSFTAKNVKVITVGHKVTLRGPVNSARERAAVEAIAKQTAGVTEIDNQIDVKP